MFISLAGGRSSRSRCQQGRFLVQDAKRGSIWLPSLACDWPASPCPFASSPQGSVPVLVSPFYRDTSPFALQLTLVLCGLVHLDFVCQDLMPGGHILGTRLRPQHGEGGGAGGHDSAMTRLSPQRSRPGLLSVPEDTRSRANRRPGARFLGPRELVSALETREHLACVALACTQQGGDSRGVWMAP